MTSRSNERGDEEGKDRNGADPARPPVATPPDDASVEPAPAGETASNAETADPEVQHE